MSTKTTAEHTPSLGSTKTTPRRTILAAIALLTAAALASLAIPLGFSALYDRLNIEETFFLTSLGGVVATLALGVLAVAYLQRRDIEIPISRPAGREWLWIVGGIVLSLIGAIVFAILEGRFATGMAASSSSSLAAEASAVTIVLVGVYFVLVIGPIEEYLYRGVIQGRLRQYFGPAVAIGLTSLGFAVGHAPNFWLAGSDVLSVGVLIALGGIAVASVILGAIYEKTANLAVVALVHGLFNAIIFALAVGFMA